VTEMICSVRDVVGTAFVNAGIATDTLKRIINDDTPVSLDILHKTKLELLSAITDIVLAEEMLDDNWETTIYIGEWK
jgi:hypothetical protein